MQHSVQKALKISLLSASVMLAAMSQQANATNGYAGHGFGTVQKAMGGAAVAGHDNAMNMATNPASMSFGENNWTAGLDIFVPDRNANHAGRPAMPEMPLANFFPPGTPLPPGATVPASPAIPGANFDGNDDSNFPIPEFAYQRHLNQKFAVGVAVYGNGGMNATYDKPIYSNTGITNTGLDLAQLFIAPSVSMKINEDNSVGASLNLAYQRFKINGVDAFAPFSRSPGDLSDRGYDDSTGVGVSVGWQGKLSDTLKAGLTYRSETKMSEFDKYKGLFAEQGDFDIPAMITLGMSYEATPNTTVAFDVARIKYSKVKSIGNKNNTGGLQQQLVAQNFGIIPAGTPLQGPMLGDDDGAGFGWDDQTVFKLGVKHKLNNKITLLGGYNHGKSPISESETAFNILAPATVEDHVTVGLDYKLSKTSSLTFAYMHAFNNEIKGDGTMTPAGPASPGAMMPIGPNPLTDFTPANIEMNQNSFAVSYSKNF